MYNEHDSQDFAITFACNKLSEQSFGFDVTIYRMKTNLAFARKQSKAIQGTNFSLKKKKIQHSTEQLTKQAYRLLEFQS